MNSLESIMMQSKIDELQHQISMQSGTISQMLDMIRVALEDDDDPEEALRLVKEFIGD